MKKILLFCLISASFSCFSQEIQAVDVQTNFNPENIFRNIQNQQDRAVTCSLDTLLYLTAKATGSTALSINNATSAKAMAQYFDAPQDITISGTDFVAYKTNLDAGSAINVTVEIFLAGADSLPTGTALASSIVSVDTNFYGGDIIQMRKSATFSVAITVSAPYCVVVTNDSPNAITMFSNDYNTTDGGQEWLASAEIGTSWVRGYNVNVGGITFDADMFMHPHISYDLASDFTISPNCQDAGGMVTANHLSSPILANRMYSFQAYVGTSENQTTWDWGDASATEVGVGLTHTYAAGTFNVELTDTLFGWTTNCTDGIIKSTCDQPAEINENESQITVYPNPTRGTLNITTDTEMTLVKVYDLSGRLVSSESISEISTTSIELDKLPAGIYTLKISLENGDVVNRRIELIK